VATIVVGIEDSFRAQDAVALAADLARTTDVEVVAVSVYPYDDRPSEHYNSAIRPSLERAANGTLERLSEPLSQGSVRRVVVADTSPARALMRIAAAAKAELIVIGSSHGEFTGRLRPGSTAWRLLQGAPCAVALAPQGHRLRPHTALNRVTAAFDGSPGGYAALSTAARIAGAMEQRLRVVRVFEKDCAAPPWLPDAFGFLRLAPDAERAARSALERAVTGHPGAAVAFLKHKMQSSYSTPAALAAASGLPVLGAVSFVRGAKQKAVEAQQFKWFAGAGGALAGAFVLLLAVEFVQRGLMA